MKKTIEQTFKSLNKTCQIRRDESNPVDVLIWFVFQSVNAQNS